MTFLMKLAPVFLIRFVCLSHVFSVANSFYLEGRHLHTTVPQLVPRELVVGALQHHNPCFERYKNSYTKISRADWWHRSSFRRKSKPDLHAFEEQERKKLIEDDDNEESIANPLDVASNANLDPAEGHSSSEKNGLKCSTKNDGNQTVESDAVDAGNSEVPGDGTYTDDSIDFEWRVGDVFEDLKLLEQGIILNEAENKVKEVERLETLDAFAAQRREILPDMHNFVTRTLTWSLIFTVTKRFILKQQHKSYNRLLARLIHLPWDLHFWLIVVIAPMVALFLKRRTTEPPPELPYELRNLEREYLEMTHYGDPSNSSQDVLLCLSEQWVSAIKGIAWLGMFQAICCALVGFKRLPGALSVIGSKVVPYFTPSLMGLLQFLTRVGAMLSLYQFPSLLFQLQRSQQPRPIRADVTLFQRLVDILFQWSLPVGLASDLSQATAPLSKRGLLAFYGGALTILSAMELRFNESRKPPKRSTINVKKGRLRLILRRVISNTVAGITAAIFLTRATCYLWVHVFDPKRQVKLPRIDLLPVTTGSIVLRAVIGPIWHMVAFKRLVRVLYTHDLSLAADPAIWETVMNNPQEQTRRYRWRYRLEWRKPERVDILVEKAFRQFWYWWFFSGTVEDKLTKERQESRKRMSYQDYKDIWLWPRIERELKYYDEPPDRTKWKDEAIKKMTQKYQADYETKSWKNTNPLGVAVQQRLGVGLGFMTDFTRKLKPGEKPTLRLLQARAAKSAVDYVNNYFRKRILMSKELQKTESESAKRQEMLDAYNKEMEKKIQDIAQRLVELIPKQSSNPKEFKFQEFHTKTINVGGKWMRITDTGVRENCKTGEWLLENYSPDGKGRRYEAIPLEGEEMVEEDDPYQLDTNYWNDTMSDDDKAELEEWIDNHNRKNQTKSADEDYLKRKFGGYKGRDDDEDNFMDIVYA